MRFANPLKARISKQKKVIKRILTWFIIPIICLSCVLILSFPSYASQLGGMYFTPSLITLKNLFGRNEGAELNVRVAVTSPKVGSASVETNNPFMYFNVYNWPDPDFDFPCGYGTPEEIAGLSARTGGRTLVFQHRASCREGEGYYLGAYEARVTDNTGVHPGPNQFQPMETIQTLIDN